MQYNILQKAPKRERENICLVVFCMIGNTLACLALPCLALLPFPPLSPKPLIIFHPSTYTQEGGKHKQTKKHPDGPSQT
ncbi:hypothetical protein EJ04DRAFT_123090 [Polyplosphaeria fusca]|uniref:Uncharacterized protein n=1 Tax=Polyplosphaeria fusca TaxID=682080 RepID=A0A9P4UWL9_9PLEO|nr:hypothetical protein EJ04DRAFT_123090 [Polyplosphaeria fusca]